MKKLLLILLLCASQAFSQSASRTFRVDTVRVFSKDSSGFTSRFWIGKKDTAKVSPHDSAWALITRDTIFLYIDNILAMSIDSSKVWIRNRALLVGSGGSGVAGGGGGGGAVSSVFGRQGNVIALPGDYAAYYAPLNSGTRISTDTLDLGVSGSINGLLRWFDATSHTQKMLVDGGHTQSILFRYKTTNDTVAYLSDITGTGTGSMKKQQILDTLNNASPTAITFLRELSFGTSAMAQTINLYKGANVRYGFGIQADELRSFVSDAATIGHTWGTIANSDGTTFVEQMRLSPTGLGIGTTASAKLHVQSTTEQLRLGYDGTHYTSFTQDGNGYLTLIPSGGKLGIGQTPHKTLDVYGGANSQIWFNRDANTAGNYCLLNFATNNVSKFMIGMNADNYVGTDRLYFFDNAVSASSSAMTLTGGQLAVGQSLLPSATFHVQSTTEQLRLGYDASHDLRITVDATGDPTLRSTTDGYSFYGQGNNAAIRLKRGGSGNYTGLYFTLATRDIWSFGNTYYTGSIYDSSLYLMPSGTGKNFYALIGSGQYSMFDHIKVGAFGRDAALATLDSVKLSGGSDTLFFYVGGNKFAAKKMGGSWFEIAILLGVAMSLFKRRKTMKQQFSEMLHAWMVALIFAGLMVGCSHCLFGQVNMKLIQSSVDNAPQTKTVLSASWTMDSLINQGDDSCRHDWQTLAEQQRHTDSTEIASLPDYQRAERCIVRLCNVCGRIEYLNEHLDQQQVDTPQATMSKRLQLGRKVVR